MSDDLDQDRRLTERVLALAGLFQAVHLIRQVAREGAVLNEPFQTSVASVLAIDSTSAEAVFGSRLALRLGFEVLCRQLGHDPRRHDLELARYAGGLMQLERRLLRSGALLEALRDGLGTVAAQAELYPVADENVIARLAELYVRTLSRLGPRILVRGEPGYLRDPRNADRIRALLLAGVRAVTLWRQLGGNRLRLFFARARHVGRAKAFLAELEA